MVAVCLCHIYIIHNKDSETFAKLHDLPLHISRMVSFIIAGVMDLLVLESQFIFFKKNIYMKVLILSKMLLKDSRIPAKIN